METIRKIRLAYHRNNKPIREIARDMNLSRNTVREILRSDVTEQHYERKTQHRPKLEPYKDQLTQALEEDQGKPPKHRRSAILLFEQLQREGFTGSYDSIRRFVKKWRQKDTGVTKVFIPLVFTPGKAFQFDWAMNRLSWAV